MALQVEVVVTKADNREPHGGGRDLTPGFKLSSDLHMSYVVDAFAFPTPCTPMQ